MSGVWPTSDQCHGGLMCPLVNGASPCFPSCHSPVCFSGSPSRITVRGRHAVSLRLRSGKRTLWGLLLPSTPPGRSRARPHFGVGGVSSPAATSRLQNAAPAGPGAWPLTVPQAPQASCPFFAGFSLHPCRCGAVVLSFLPGSLAKYLVHLASCIPPCHYSPCSLVREPQPQT